MRLNNRVGRKRQALSTPTSGKLVKQAILPVLILKIPSNPFSSLARNPITTTVQP
jgi:hypothetical protein